MTSTIFAHVRAEVNEYLLTTREEYRCIQPLSERERKASFRISALYEQVVNHQGWTE
jgi:hypothetical protein